MNKDDQRARETVQAELRRRRSASDTTGEERPVRPGSTGCSARAAGEERRPALRRHWSLPSGPAAE